MNDWRMWLKPTKDLSDNEIREQLLYASKILTTAVDELEDPSKHLKYLLYITNKLFGEI